MSSGGDNYQVPDRQDAPDDRDEEDDDFGDFEGFEGGVEHMQAQPAPSPWATFPDLLPVQSSPATPAEDGQASTSRNPNPQPREAWQPQNAGLPWQNNPGPSHEEPRPLPQQLPRTLNPPDVSLGTNQAVGGRLTPDNVHDIPDAALAVVMDHLDNDRLGDTRAPVAAMDRLHQQLENAEHGRLQLEEQVEGLRQRNAELEQQVDTSNQQINDLSSRLQRNQEMLEQRLSEIQHLNSTDWREDLHRIQSEVLAIKQFQENERNELETSRNNLEEMRNGICGRFQTLETNIQKEYAEMEKRLLSKFEEQCREIKSAVDTVVQRTAQQVSGSLSQIVTDAVQNTNGDHQGNNLLQSIKVELEKHKEQQKKLLEEERQRQLVTVSSALQSALQHLSQSISNDSKQPKDNNKPS